MITSEKTTVTREEWLKRGLRAMRPLLRKADVKMRSRWQVSVSLASTRQAIGQCWYEGSSMSGQTANIFVCPRLSDPVDVLDTLLHEMVHAALPQGVGHGAPFRKVCKIIGLTKGKPTEAGAGPELRAVLERLSAHLGPYPHDAMVLREGKKGTKGGYWPIFESPKDPRYRICISERSLEEYGPPRCPLTGQFMRPADGKAPPWPRKKK